MRQENKILTIYEVTKVLFTEQKNLMKWGPFFVRRADIKITPWGKGHIIQRNDSWQSTISLLPKITFHKYRWNLGSHFNSGLSVDWFKWNVWIDFSWFKFKKK